MALDEVVRIVNLGEGGPKKPRSREFPWRHRRRERSGAKTRAEPRYGNKALRATTYGDGSRTLSITNATHQTVFLPLPLSTERVSKTTFSPMGEKATDVRGRKPRRKISSRRCLSLSFFYEPLFWFSDNSQPSELLRRTGFLAPPPPPDHVVPFFRLQANSQATSCDMTLTFTLRTATRLK